ncbi:MAG: 2-amino-4-hydroxy-6-hydroxymethyldihydropteridine diphosphokinase [Burkholderiaceae bacterium]
MAQRIMVQAFIGIGANLGDARATVQQAVRDLSSMPFTRVLRASSLYRSAPVDAQGPDFINAVAMVDTALTAPELLAQLQALEQRAGRKRPYPNAPRTLDLDLLLFGDARIDSPSLTVPHPRWAQRAFVLLPLAELAPDRVSAPQRVAVAGQRIERLD